MNLISNWNSFFSLIQFEENLLMISGKLGSSKCPDTASSRFLRLLKVSTNSCNFFGRTSSNTSRFLKIFFTSLPEILNYKNTLYSGCFGASIWKLSNCIVKHWETPAGYRHQIIQIVDIIEATSFQCFPVFYYAYNLKLSKSFTMGSMKFQS